VLYELSWFNRSGESPASDYSFRSTCICRRGADALKRIAIVRESWFRVEGLVASTLIVNAVPITARADSMRRDACASPLAQLQVTVTRARTRGTKLAATVACSPLKSCGRLRLLNSRALHLSRAHDPRLARCARARNNCFSSRVILERRFGRIRLRVIVGPTAGRKPRSRWRGRRARRRNCHRRSTQIYREFDIGTRPTPRERPLVRIMSLTSRARRSVVPPRFFFVCGRE